MSPRRNPSSGLLLDAGGGLGAQAAGEQHPAAAVPATAQAWTSTKPRRDFGRSCPFGCGCMGWPSTHKLCLSTQLDQQQRAQGPLSAQLRLLLTPGSAPSCQEVSLRITSLALRHRTAQRGQEEGTSEACAAKEFLLCCGWCIPAQSSSRIACTALR